MQVYVINVVDDDGVSNALVFKEPVEGSSFRRALKIHNENGTTSWIQNDDGELPSKEAPDGDYDDRNVYGITWHLKK